MCTELKKKLSCNSKLFDYISKLIIVMLTTEVENITAKLSEMIKGIT